MPATCCAYGCNNRLGEKPGLSFYRFPVESERRSKWVAAVKRMNWEPNEHSRLCGEHFISGKKSNHPLSPDFVPTMFEYVASPMKRRGKKAAVDFERRQQLKRRKMNEERKCTAVSALLSLAASEDVNTATATTSTVCVDAEVGDTEGTYVQTEMHSSDVQALLDECKNLREENLHLRKKLKISSLELDSFTDNDGKVRYFTGLPTFAVMLVLFNFICPLMKVKSTLSAFQQFLLTCMRLRMNVSVQYLGYCFGISTSTASRVFLNTINIMYYRLVPLLVIWPEREVLRATMPVSFRSKFSKCACIIDCFELFIERPSDLKARAQTYSTYKSHNTMKYLIAITPQGTISFISKGWGGRVSDKHITEHCGFLDKLLPGDLILADRGFDVGDTVGLYAANLQIPAFTKGKSQLSALDVEATRGLASVRIHVERVIGMTRQKYTMLGSTVPITLLQTDTGSSLTTLDKIVHVASALTNASETIVALE